MKSSVIIIVNPAARKSSQEKIDAVVSFFSGKGLQADVLKTTGRGDAEVFARQAVLQKPELVISAGGDGTFNEVINGLACSDIPLGLLPMGTTNVLAREIYDRLDLSTILDSFAGTPKYISLGRIMLDASADTISRFFSLMAGVGFDGQAVRDVNLGMKVHTGPGAYVLSGLRTLLSYAPEELCLSVDGKDVNGYAAIIGNISRYGGDFKVTPDARIDEPALYACVFQGKKRSDLLRYAFLMLSGRHIRAKDVVYCRATEIKIGGAAPIQIDGDYLGMTPATISVAKDVIRLVY